MAHRISEKDRMITKVQDLRDKCALILQESGPMEKKALYGKITPFFTKRYDKPYHNFVRSLQTDKEARFLYEDGWIRLRTPKEVLELIEEHKLIMEDV